jgi:hypothetical protein
MLNFSENSGGGGEMASSSSPFSAPVNSIIPRLPHHCLQNFYHFLYFFIIPSGARLSPLGTAATTDLLDQPQTTDDDGCGAIGGIKIGRGNRSTRRKPAPAPLRPPQIPHYQTRVRTRAAAVGSQLLTA